MFKKPFIEEVADLAREFAKRIEGTTLREEVFETMDPDAEIDEEALQGADGSWVSEERDNEDEMAPTEGRSIHMARSIRAPVSQKRAEPIWTWRTQSSQPRGGEIISYETRLEETGIIRCNCPGWIFSKGSPEDKTCRHKRDYLGEAPEILRKWKSGEELPILNATPIRNDSGTPGTVEEKKKSVADKHSKIKYGRLIEL
jgi:hypothetical protein